MESTISVLSCLSLLVSLSYAEGKSLGVRAKHFVGRFSPCDPLHSYTSVGYIIMEAEQAKKTKTESSFSPYSLPLFLLEFLSSNPSVVDGTGPFKQIAVNQSFPLQEGVGHGAYHIHRKQRRTVLTFFR